MVLTRTGNWAGVRGLINSLSAEIRLAQMQSLRTLTAHAESVAVKHLASQDLNWTPLNPKTIERKVRLGFSDLILIETSTYMQNITSWVNGSTGFAGVKRGVVGADGIELGSLAAIHEYGKTISMAGKTIYIPARPLWQPVLEEVEGWQASNSSNNPAQIFLRNIKAKFGI